MLNDDEFRLQAGRSVQDWARVLATRLSVDDSWRLLLAGTITVMQAEHGPQEVAALLRHAAELIEQEPDSAH